MRKHRFSKFAIVGCLGAALQLSILALLTKHMPPIPATVLSVELAILHNFLWHERYTWPGRTPQHILTRLTRFHLANGLVSLCGNTFLTYLLVTHFHLPTLPSALAAIGLCSLANFTLTDQWVYKSHEHAASKIQQTTKSKRGHQRCPLSRSQAQPYPPRTLASLLS